MLKERLIQTFGDNELKLAEKWSSRPTGTAVYQDRNQRATVKSVFAKGEMCGWPRDVDHFLASHFTHSILASQFNAGSMQNHQIKQPGLRYT